MIGDMDHELTDEERELFDMDDDELLRRWDEGEPVAVRTGPLRVVHASGVTFTDLVFFDSPVRLGSSGLAEGIVFEAAAS